MSSPKSEAEPRRRPTLSAVASLADVSISTVSKVLNGRGGVSNGTRARIEAILNDHQYNRRPSRSTIAPLVEVLCYEIGSPFASEVIAHLESVAREQELGLVLTGATDRKLPERSWVGNVLQRRPLGVVLVASLLPVKDQQRLRASHIPIVVVDPAGSPAPDLPSIGSADWKGAFQATKHLVDLGHTRIGTITGPPEMLASTARLSGYRAALDAAGLPVPVDLIRPGEFHHQDGVREGRVLLDRRDRPTAVFASSDLYALGVYEAARSLGIDIPGGLSVVGYDDLPIAKWAGPPLTTVHVPIAAMVRQAMHMLMRLRSEPQLAFSHVDMDTTLVVRDSTAPPRAKIR